MKFHRGAKSKIRRILYLLSLLILFGSSLITGTASAIPLHPLVYTVVPSSAHQGDTLNVLITGVNFFGVTGISFGAGVFVNGFAVIDNLNINANITVAADASLGTRDVSATSQEGTGTKTAGFMVLQKLQMQQSAQVPTATGTGIATFTTSNGSINNLTASLTTACGALIGYNFPQGVFSFNITNITPGSTVTITITLPSNMPANTQYWKCLNGQWLNCYSILGSNDGDSILTLTLTDGGPFDADGTANGTIVDPGGPVVLAAAPAGAKASGTVPNQLRLDQAAVQYMTINPKQAAVNQPVAISTNVANTGDNSVNYNVALMINGQMEQSRMVSVGPHASQPVKFTVTRAQPGTYSVDIAGQSGSFTILGSGNSASTPTANSGLVGILIIGVMVALVIVLALILRRSTR
jgi:hypothetical protein